MAPLTAGGEGADGEWWKGRLAALGGRAAALAAEVAKQEAERRRLKMSTSSNQSLSEDLDGQAWADAQRERVAQSELESELAAMALACESTRKLDTEKKLLLDAISDANYRLGQQCVAANMEEDLEAEATRANATAVGRAKILKENLRSLGDKQASLASAEEAECLKRRQLREGIRNKLHFHASERTEIERRLAGRSAEIEKWQRRLDAAAAAEKHATEESRRLREQAHKWESLLGPQKDREREELRRQLRETAAVDDHLRDELRETKERLWRKEQRQYEQGGRPWAAFTETMVDEPLEVVC